MVPWSYDLSNYNLKEIGQEDQEFKSIFGNNEFLVSPDYVRVCLKNPWIN